MGHIGMPEMLVILVILLLLFGSTKLPALGRAMGDTIRNFKRGVRESSDEQEKNP